ncbi:MAG: hypothetical protein LBJ17_04470 [Dysgonamonadaceae bacterium]|jgi:hypothetical protein|nr:hypothetical protein [Dysgonamonadaceae bacterium]
MSRKSKTLPQSPEIWSGFLSVRIEVLCTALDLLSIDENTKKDENEISKALNVTIKEASFRHEKRPETPAWDAKKAPKTEDERHLPSIGKRPDFIYKFVDPTAESAKNHEILLDIECKRIGNNNPLWNLNMNYVDKGIKRFDLLSHEYGKDSIDGIMIGYIIDSVKIEIQEVINKALPGNIEQINFKNSNKVEHVITKYFRKNVSPADFNLHHIWADFTKIT